ncbi:N-acetylglucosamine transport system permease protein [Actinopolymorpha cephalotaxi]|uniref:N-acetylglucosamine transport system permease protein n=1 Tax=Actinopolymorpha cephalotaxi TaxID=504797 RepID=A0A1I3APT9_9ACTN|nr:carbohydrate ABC transporter permease [Actinopolymorpha cephalotaxi]NYH86002.1 N-acetylglucosamine transport system permease protein [Actinopolymorpha cephalotaxi]SFH52064.1 N-acetylglucosamine transport system permease protein [Actinopolymorpha cephalotaxi]
MTQVTEAERARAPRAPRTSRRDSAQESSVAYNVVAHVLLTLWALIVLLPLVWVLVSSFKTTQEVLGNPLTWPHHFEWQNYANAWTTSGVGRYFLNTVIVVGSALVIVMLLGAMCSYVLARFKFPGNRVVYYLMLAGLTFPVFLAIVPLFFVLQNFGLLNTLPGLILTYVAFALPFTVFFLHSFFKTLPYDVYEAAQVDGAGEWRTFFQVMLPMARPGIASVAIFNFLGLWNQFLLPVALNTDTGNYVLTQGMASFQSQAGYSVDFGALFAAVVITVTPVLVVYIIFQRQLRDSVVAGAVK